MSPVIYLNVWFTCVTNLRSYARINCHCVLDTSGLSPICLSVSSLFCRPFLPFLFSLLKACPFLLLLLFFYDLRRASLTTLCSAYTSDIAILTLMILQLTFYSMNFIQHFCSAMLLLFLHVTFLH